MLLHTTFSKQQSCSDFCLKSVDGRQLSARHGYLWPAEVILCFLHMGAEARDDLRSRGGCVTMCFRGTDTQKCLDFVVFSE